MAEQTTKQKYTVLKIGRHGQVGDVLMLHPRQATFMLTEQRIAKGELKGKALQDVLKQLAKSSQQEGDADNE